MGPFWHPAQAAPPVADQVDPSHASLLTDSSLDSIKRGLTFLAQQQREDGSFGTRGYARNVGVCSLAGMAFLASGSTPGRGVYARKIDQCIEYLLAHSSAEGFIAAVDASSRGPMYGHGFATLFLCEAYGMSEQPGLRDTIGQAVQVIVEAQNAEGGWRYQPESSAADISVTVCQVMALRAARNAGISVPRETIDRSIAYVKACQNPDGGFRYMLSAGRAPISEFARSAAGVVSLYNGGIYEGPEIERGLAYLMQFFPDKDKGSGGSGYYFYGQYYAAQAMWHAGGPAWQRWFPAIRDHLVARQRADGSWMDSICAEYGTAMATIVLQVPNNYLPILQR
ncbi:MAG: terpene cyclase/mutase family protein [Pirellulales bacterium]|nr:terpene cyclase/mutase family protein [Pirellulales bacterium]